jgi:hypothetical protein
MRHAFIALVLFLVGGAVSKADTVVNVAIQPTLIGCLNTGGCETVGVSFNWDTTNNTFSDLIFTQSGPFPAFTGMVQMNSSGFSLGSDALGSLSVFREVPGRTDIGSAPGIYHNIDLNFFCPSGCAEGDNFNLTDAVVTAVSTPEPGTLTLVGMGLLGLVNLRKARRDRLTAGAVGV